MMTKNRVLLLKAQKSDEFNDKYDVNLTQAGYAVKQVKTLDFEYKNLNKYEVCLNEPYKYSGIIFTSPRCVNATELALKGAKLSEQWKEKYNFVVGETTAGKALENLGLYCVGKETGNANNLADILLKDKEKYDKPFLFPHGNLKTDILKNRIQTELTLYEICIYNTIPNAKVEDDLKIATNDYTIIPEYVVYFSPSSVNATWKYLKELNTDGIKHIAIGPTTEAAMKELRLNVHGTAYRPTPQDLLNAMKG